KKKNDIVCAREKYQLLIVFSFCYWQIDVHRDQYERATMSWNPRYGILESHHYLEPNTTRHIFNEDPCFTRRSKSLGSGNPNSGSNDNKELDLELRLSL
ncbi:BnaAnng36090D, partial [Brassica napus]